MKAKPFALRLEQETRKRLEEHARARRMSLAAAVEEFVSIGLRRSASWKKYKAARRSVVES